MLTLITYKFLLKTNLLINWQVIYTVFLVNSLVLYTLRYFSQFLLIVNLSDNWENKFSILFFLKKISEYKKDQIKNKHELEVYRHDFTDKYIDDGYDAY